MESQKFLLLYFLVILKIFIPECAGSPVNEPLSAHNDSMLGRDINGNDENTQINIKSDVTNDDNSTHFSVTNEQGVVVVIKPSCNKQDDIVKNIAHLQETILDNGVLLKNKMDEVTGMTKKEQQTNLEKSVLLEKKIDELMNKTKKEQESNLEKSALLENKMNELTSEIKTNMKKILKMLSCDKSPAFTGSSYLAIAAPEFFTNFSMSMEVKAAAPVTDGIIMYCAEKVAPYLGGFMSLAVRQGRLEFRFYLGPDWDPLIVLTADRTLPANEWTNIEVSRVGFNVVSLRINSGAALEGRLVAGMLFNPRTPLFIGGVDGSTVLHNNTAVSGGFKGCIKGAQVNIDDNIRINNIETAASKSNKVQKCCDNNDE